MPTRISAIEDDAAVAASLEALLGSYGFEVERFETGEAFLAVEGERPSCILLDVRLPGMDGLAVLETYRRTDEQTPIIIMTGHGDVAMAVEALRRGAQDVIEKPFDGDDLVRRIGLAIDQAAPGILSRQKLDSLTPRETDVLRGIVAGQQNKVIAHNLGISQKTVELHRARVMRKTGSRSVSQLTQVALSGGLQIDETD